jgi:GTP-binding protein
MLAKMENLLLQLLQQRLDRESDTNISLEITKSDEGAYYIAGRGELQLSILIEPLRREVYEFQERKPRSSNQRRKWSENGTS